MTTITSTRRPHLGGVVSAGLLQARIELTNRFTRWTALGYLFPPAVLLTVFALIDIQATVGVEAIQAMAASLAAALLFVTGFVGIAGELITEQDDGTMLRVRMLPYGLSAHLIGKVVTLLATGLLTMLLILVPTQIALAPVLPDTVGGWAGLLGVALLAIAATVPLGAIIGSVFRSPLAVFPASLAAYGLLTISGVFIPLDALPDWLAVIAMAFPVAGLATLSRAVLIPGAEQLTTGEMALAVGVPVLWAVVGLLLVPRALRAMTRRQSGSRLEQIRIRKEQRGY